VHKALTRRLAKGALTGQPRIPVPGAVYVPETSSMSCDQVVFVYQATDASLSSDAVLVEIDRFG
jgi:hypothetical protein